MYTDKETFCNIPILQTSDISEITKGERAVTIPHDTMHTWEAQNNQIAWYICTREKVRWWVDVNEEYPILILPQKGLSV